MVKRILVEKTKGFDIEARHLAKDLKDNLHIDVNVRIINRYDIEGILDETYKKAKETVFSEANVDEVFDENMEIPKDAKVFAIEYLPGQYDQRGDWASQCVQIIDGGKRPIVSTAKVYILQGNITDSDLERIKNYCINPVDSREASLEKPSSLISNVDIPDSVETLDGFIDLDGNGLKEFLNSYGLAMTFLDLEHIQNYFVSEKRNPTITEIKVLDTYWSDHCRHTTFMTEIENVAIDSGKYTDVIKKAFDMYLDSRKNVYVDRKKDICLMDIATINTKELKKAGKISDLDESEEINACSIKVDIDLDGKKVPYLVMFKNETHNHPTEIEPFGGAATCLGGAIRDPLSGRSYVYQAMRVTGSADPRKTIEETLKGKLMQRKITTEAAHGYSSYGNQIGLQTGQVAEVYDEDFVAKRMEIGAVIAAAPEENVIRLRPENGDIVVLLGGKTGRDGCGGATGSSKEHNEHSTVSASAEVQKGDALNERKIQRFFRNPSVTKMIKRCNDFGAGGVCVAIGEVADSLDINLDLVPKKYEGLDGTEIAISESQERMAVVIRACDKDTFISLANVENLEATHVATVTDSGRMRMFWNGNAIVDLSREFIETSGVKQVNDVHVARVSENHTFFNKKYTKESLKSHFISNLKDLNVCSQKGLVERFDNTIGANSVLSPFGGKYRETPSQGMVAKIPVIGSETDTSTMMTFGYNPKIGKWSPFHGALYAVVESTTKIVALGGNIENVRLTLQEYFERLGKDPIKWGKPFSALLGAFYAQNALEIPAIGGKDSMSGTYNELNVPPTLVSFAVNVENAKNIVSNEFKKKGSKVLELISKRGDDGVIDFVEYKKNMKKVYELAQKGKILSAYAIGYGGSAEAVFKMSIGNKIGFKFTNVDDIFTANYGNILLEIAKEDENLFDGLNYALLGETTKTSSIILEHEEISLNEALEAFNEPLESVFNTKTTEITGAIETVSFKTQKPIIKAKTSIAKPKVFIPVFPGTNCEYDLTNAFLKAGADVETLVFRNLLEGDIENSIENIVKGIENSQIIMFPGGFSAGDEPDGSGKFIKTVFRNPKVEEAINNYLDKTDGLMLGICNGFQALVKLGLLPYGKICDTDINAPTLTYNNIGRHQASIVNTRISSNMSPWLQGTTVGDIHSIAISHGEGRFVANDDVVAELIKNGQIATQYVDLNESATYDIKFNPNGSTYGIEGITSIDGRIFGKMGHSERIGTNVIKNIYGEKDQKIFESGVNYFK